ncbi:sigma-70 family RNA polymerase sigma factor [Lentilactobacillus kosonis]|uniref:RNA polymerase sigma factor, sigma-70 family n=1 Tax=Lentilactobacillus kosonis TaxID=2810561 RepID=A0A401FI33_9LACO|nr:sigma-70 family RNA polymerase sigma factor [Lentilactobacillus kosonis]GAY72040.1 hypothetical protein NBRC111893_186 [Lentilactobacillus kosonis]
MNHELTNEQYNEAFEFLTTGDHEVVIFGVLRRLHISPNHEYYDDMVQEGRLTFVNAYLKAPKTNEKRQLVYIYQKVYWSMLDYLRKQSTVNDHKYVPDEPTANQDELFEIPTEHSYVGDCETQATFAELMDICTKDERHYLLAAYKYGLNVTEIADQRGVSRPTVYKWKRSVLQKAKHIQI